jgi:hypothetical protein
LLLANITAQAKLKRMEYHIAGLKYCVFGK